MNGVNSFVHRQFMQESETLDSSDDFDDQLTEDSNEWLNASEKDVSNFKIVGGSEASLGEFPHQVAFTTELNDGTHYICGGSIIHKRIILTAAHCVQ